MAATLREGADISLQFYFCIIIELKGRKAVIISQEYVSVRSVAHLFCDHIALEVLIKKKKSKGSNFQRSYFVI